MGIHRINPSNAEATFAQRTKTQKYLKTEPCHVGIHWKALAEHYQMSTIIGKIQVTW